MSRLNLAEYQVYAKRTLPDLGTTQDNLLHMALGLITEVGELADPYKRKFAYKKDIDLVNIGEEIGDIAWYAVNALTILNFEIKDQFVLGGFDNAETLFHGDLRAVPAIISLVGMASKTSAITAAVIEGVVKVGFIGNIYFPLVDILKIINGLCRDLNIDLEEILFKNIEKLKVRFPDKFSEDSALNRDLEKEREALK